MIQKKYFVLLLFFTLLLNSIETFSTEMDEEGLECKSNASCEIGWQCRQVNLDQWKCVKLCQKPEDSDGNLCDKIHPECFISDEGHSSYCGCIEGSCNTGSICVGTKCIPCPKGYTHVDGQSCNCPPGTASNGKEGCLACQKGQNCSCKNNFISNGQGDCVECNTVEDCGDFGKKCLFPGQLNSQCIDLECEKGEYIVGNHCEKCPDGCETCQGINLCKSCAAGHYLAGGKCISCAKKFGIGCGKCSIQSSKCEVCKLGYIKNKKDFCVPITCLNDEFLSGDICTKCSRSLKNCLSCSNEEECTKCTSPRMVLNSNKKCICPLGWKFTKNKNDCEKIPCKKGEFHTGSGCAPCPEECTDCSSTELCYACNNDNGFILSENKCTKIQCNFGEYRNKISCLKCSDKINDCISCSEDGNKCLECKTGFRIENGKCLPIICEKDEFLKGNSCLKCAQKFEHCASCNEGMCLTCEKLHELKNGTCQYKKCTGNTFLNKISDSCEECPIGTKSNGSDCEKIICPQGQYLDGNDCKKCNESCLTCSNKSFCDTCPEGKGIYDKGFCSNRKIGYFYKQHHYIPCNQKIPGCTECTNDGSICLDCGRYKMDILQKCIVK